MKNKIITILMLFAFVCPNILLANNSSTKEDDESPLIFFETPISYENKKETSFKVFQVLFEGGALAMERSDNTYSEIYLGKVVFLAQAGCHFYNDQIVVVKKPVMVGTFTYTTKSGSDKTVPIITWLTFTNEECQQN